MSFFFLAHPVVCKEVFYCNLYILFYVTFCVFKLNVRFYLLCIHIDIFMHCALYVFYKANKDDYYNKSTTIYCT